MVIEDRHSSDTAGISRGRRKIVGIGEIGLDYYRNISLPEIQREAFREQLDLAMKLELPVVVHIRDAIDDSFKILRESGISKGVLHSFPGSADKAKEAVKMGFYISFAGPITYSKSTRAEIAKSVPLGRILTETDSPYLTPQAYRGQRNKPEYVRYVIAKLAELHAPYTFEDIERITSHNARKAFCLPHEKNPEIVYKIRRSVYINYTNRCSCNCHFCPRVHSGFVAGHYLKLQREPSAGEVIAEINSFKDFDEIVFCGLGEPTMRLAELLEISSLLKKRGHFIRLDTNGHGSLINKTNVPSKLKGLIDKISISLNAQDAETYVKICRPDSGAESYLAMVKFAEDCVALGIKTELSAVRIPEVDIEACRKIANELQAGFRIREYSQDDGNKG
jgi:TatD DNase family protein